MKIRIVNLTHLAVDEMITQVLATYPNSSHRELFSHPDSRKRLLTYVLNRIQNRFLTLEQNESVPTEVKKAYLTASCRSKIENLIHWGVNFLTNTDRDSNQVVISTGPDPIVSKLMSLEHC